MNIPTSRRVTLKDIAQVCGYSANTVSRALRDDTKLPEQTRRAIQALAQEMGVDAVFITKDGRTLTTPGFVEKYTYMTYEAFLTR